MYNILIMDVKSQKEIRLWLKKHTKDMNILEIAQKHPESIEVFIDMVLGCLGCAAARFENLEAGAKVHGFDPDAMVADINALIEAAE